MKLANGLRVIVARREGIPLVSAELVALSGAEIDPPRLAGLASLSAALMTQGTKRHSAPELAAAAEALGGSLDSGAGWNQALVSITVTTPKLDAALGARRRGRAHAGVRARRDRARARADARRPQGRLRSAGHARRARRRAAGLRRERLRPPGHRHAAIAAAHRPRRHRRGAWPGVPARQRGADPGRRHRRRGRPRPRAPPLRQLGRARRRAARAATGLGASTGPGRRRRRHGAARARPASSWPWPCPTAKATSARSLRS